MIVFTPAISGKPLACDTNVRHLKPRLYVVVPEQPRAECQVLAFERPAPRHHPRPAA